MATSSSQKLCVFGRAALLGLAAINLGACTTTTSASSGIAGAVAVPKKWQANTATRPRDSAALAKWWEKFRDPALNELIRTALAASPNVQTAVSKISESRARYRTERAGLLPSLTGGSSAQTARQDDRTSTGSTVRTQTYGGSLDASWQIDLFGKQRQNVKAAAAEIEQATNDLYSAQVSLAAEVADAYVTLREAEEQLTVTERSVSTRGETLQITQWREQAGQGNALDTLQASSALENARAAIPSLKETIEQTRNRLALLAGRTPGGVAAMIAKSHAIPVAPSGVNAGIPAQTLQQRPDVQAAEQAVYAAAARTKSAQRERLPSFNISGTLSTEALSSGRIFNPQSLAASLLGSLTIPIFKGGEITANIQIRTEQEKQALLGYQNTVLTALSEVENALISVRRQSERLDILNRAVDVARQAQKLSQQRYNAGDVDILNVLEAERTLNTAELDLASTQASKASAYVQLYKALGGGWSAR